MFRLRLTQPTSEYLLMLVRFPLIIHILQLIHAFLPVVFGLHWDPSRSISPKRVVGYYADWVSRLGYVVSHRDPGGVTKFNRLSTRALLPHFSMPNRSPISTTLSQMSTPSMERWTSLIDMPLSKKRSQMMMKAGQGIMPMVALSSCFFLRRSIDTWK